MLVVASFFSCRACVFLWSASEHMTNGPPRLPLCCSYLWVTPCIITLQHTRHTMIHDNARPKCCYLLLASCPLVLATSAFCTTTAKTDCLTGVRVTRKSSLAQPGLQASQPSLELKSSAELCRQASQPGLAVAVQLCRQSDHGLGACRTQGCEPAAGAAFWRAWEPASWEPAAWASLLGRASKNCVGPWAWASPPTGPPRPPW